MIIAPHNPSSAVKPGFKSSVWANKKPLMSAALRCAQAFGQQVAFEAGQIFRHASALGAVILDPFFDQGITLTRVVEAIHLRVDIGNLALHLFRHWNFQISLEAAAVRPDL